MRYSQQNSVNHEPNAYGLEFLCPENTLKYAQNLKAFLIVVVDEEQRDTIDVNICHTNDFKQAMDILKEMYDDTFRSETDKAKLKQVKELLCK